MRILWNDTGAKRTYDLYSDTGEFVGNYPSEKKAFDAISEINKRENREITNTTYERSCKRMEASVKRNCGW